MTDIIVIIIIAVAVVAAIIVGIWKKIEKEEKERKKKMIAIQVNQSLEIIENSKDIINKSKNFKTILHRYEVIFENIERLKKLQEKYPDEDITEPKPTNIEKLYLEEKPKFIKEFVSKEADEIMTKAEEVTGIKTKINIANKAIMRIIEVKKELKEEDIEKLNEKEKEIKAFIHKIQLDEFLEKAKKMEFMGQKNKALNAYKEALYFLQTDEVDDSLQKEKIDEIKTKISELSE